MNLRVIGDEVVEGGEVIARLTGRAAGPSSSLRDRLVELLEEPESAFDAGEIVARMTNDKLLDEISRRHMGDMVVACMDGTALREALAYRALRQESED